MISSSPAYTTRMRHLLQSHNSFCIINQNCLRTCITVSYTCTSFFFFLFILTEKKKLKPQYQVQEKHLTSYFHNSYWSNVTALSASHILPVTPAIDTRGQVISLHIDSLPVTPCTMFPHNASTPRAARRKFNTRQPSSGRVRCSFMVLPRPSVANIDVRGR